MGLGKKSTPKNYSITQLISNSHAKLKTAPPDGFKAMMLYAERNPDLLKYFGDNTRKVFKSIYPDVEMPKRGWMHKQ